MGIVWSRKKTGLAVTILFIIVLGVSLFFALQKPVTVAVDGKVLKSRVFFTNTVDRVLEKQAIALGKHDRVEPSLNSKVKKDTRIVITRAFNVKVIADGTAKK